MTFTDQGLKPGQNTALGAATGKAYCGTPFTIRYDDAPPVLQACGMWTIERTWKIQPHYWDCGDSQALYPESLTTRRVQVLTVRDVFPPQFIQTPDRDPPVPFWTDYGPRVTGWPLIEDIATHPDMARLGLVSYPATVEYADVRAEFHPEPRASHAQGIAVVARVWTATDRCGTAAEWRQAIHIESPTDGGRPGPLGDLAGLSVFGRGPVHARSSVAQGGVGSEAAITLKETVVRQALPRLPEHHSAPDDPLTASPHP